MYEDSSTIHQLYDLDPLPPKDSTDVETIIRTLKTIHSLISNHKEKNTFHAFKIHLLENNCILFQNFIGYLRTHKKDVRVVEVISQILGYLDLTTEQTLAFVNINGTCDLLIQCIRHHMTNEDRILDFVGDLLPMLCQDQIIIKQKFSKASNCFDVLITVLYQYSTIATNQQILIGTLSFIALLIEGDAEATKKLFLAQALLHTNERQSMSFIDAWMMCVEVATKTNDEALELKLNQLIETFLSQLCNISSRVTKNDYMNVYTRLIEIGHKFGSLSHHDGSKSGFSVNAATAVCQTLEAFCKLSFVGIKEKMSSCAELIMKLINVHFNNDNFVILATRLAVQLNFDPLTFMLGKFDQDFQILMRMLEASTSTDMIDAVCVQTNTLLCNSHNQLHLTPAIYGKYCDTLNMQLIKFYDDINISHALVERIDELRKIEVACIYMANSSFTWIALLLFLSSSQHNVDFPAPSCFGVCKTITAMSQLLKESNIITVLGQPGLLPLLPTLIQKFWKDGWILSSLLALTDVALKARPLTIVEKLAFIDAGKILVSTLHIERAVHSRSLPRRTFDEGCFHKSCDLLPYLIVYIDTCENIDIRDSFQYYIEHLVDHLLKKLRISARVCKVMSTLTECILVAQNNPTMVQDMICYYLFKHNLSGPSSWVTIVKHYIAIPTHSDSKEVLINCIDVLSACIRNLDNWILQAEKIDISFIQSHIINDSFMSILKIYRLCYQNILPIEEQQHYRFILFELSKLRQHKIGLVLPDMVLNEFLSLLPDFADVGCGILAPNLYSKPQQQRIAKMLIQLYENNSKWGDDVSMQIFLPFSLCMFAWKETDLYEIYSPQWTLIGCSVFNQFYLYPLDALKRILFSVQSEKCRDTFISVLLEQLFALPTKFDDQKLLSEYYLIADGIIQWLIEDSNNIWIITISQLPNVFHLILLLLKFLVLRLQSHQMEESPCTLVDAMVSYITLIMQVMKSKPTVPLVNQDIVVELLNCFNLNIPEKLVLPCFEGFSALLQTICPGDETVHRIEEARVRLNLVSEYKSHEAVVAVTSLEGTASASLNHNSVMDITTMSLHDIVQLLDDNACDLTNVVNVFDRGFQLLAMECKSEIVNVEICMSFLILTMKMNERHNQPSQIATIVNQLISKLLDLSENEVSKYSHIEWAVIVQWVFQFFLGLLSDNCIDARELGESFELLPNICQLLENPFLSMTSDTYVWDNNQIVTDAIALLARLMNHRTEILGERRLKWISWMLDKLTYLTISSIDQSMRIENDKNLFSITIALLHELVCCPSRLNVLLIQMHDVTVFWCQLHKYPCSSNMEIANMSLDGTILISLLLKNKEDTDIIILLLESLSNLHSILTVTVMHGDNWCDTLLEVASHHIKKTAVLSLTCHVLYNLVARDACTTETTIVSAQHFQKLINLLAACKTSVEGCIAVCGVLRVVVDNKSINYDIAQHSTNRLLSILKVIQAIHTNSSELRLVLEYLSYKVQSMSTVGIKETVTSTVATVEANNVTIIQDLHLTKQLDVNVHQGIWKGCVNVIVKHIVEDKEEIKKVLMSSTPDQQSTSFQLEDEMLYSLRHPRIISLLGNVKLFSSTYRLEKSLSNAIMLEYCKNKDFRQLIEREFGKLSIMQKIQILLDICEGMQFLHASHVIHGDLKTMNILIDEHYRAKISGFGSERVQMMIKAPSKFDSRNIVNRSSDVYAFGVIMWELETGKIPWEAKVTKQASLGLSAKESKECPEDIKRLLDMCMDNDVMKRPSFAELFTILNEMFEGETKRVADMRKAIPDGFLCPITQDIMRDPVILVSEGHSYERKSIVDWFARSSRSPLTNKELGVDERLLVDNYALKAAIDSFREMNRLSR